MSPTLPLLEHASDIYPTVAIQHKKTLGLVGISNQLLPNAHAIMDLAHFYDFKCASDSGRTTPIRTTTHRQFFRLTKR